MDGRRCVLAVVITMAGWMATGCATVLSGSHQDLTVTSQPEALCVTINGEPYGATPVVASLPRGATYLVQVRKDSYLPYEMTVVPVTNQMIWGNLVLGGLIGMAVDGATKAAYEHQPSRVHAFFPTPQGQTPLSNPVECAISQAVLDERQKRIVKTVVEGRQGYTPYVGRQGS